MPRLMIIIASTRPVRAGASVAEWFCQRAASHGAFELDIVDLAELGLPFLDEPKHPRLREYVHAHTLQWSARVVAADAFVFVTPEYNAGFNAPLKNAIDFLHHEWRHKPVGFVSYGGIPAGTRAVQMLKQVVSALRMVPLHEAVAIPAISELIDGERRLRPDERMEEAVPVMLDELARVEATLRLLRADVGSAS